MTVANTIDLADQIIATLRAHEAELRKAGIRGLSVFGSAARGDAEADSDVDLAAELDPDAQIGLFALIGLERRLTKLLGRQADLLTEPIENRVCATTSSGIVGVPSRHEPADRLADKARTAISYGLAAFKRIQLAP